MNSLRTIAVDWSGAVSGVRKKLWLAEAKDGQLVRLEAGRTREALAAFLITESRQTPEMAVGLDFAFSLPSWYLAELGIEDGPALWNLVAREGETWLKGCERPFWGRPGRSRPDLREHFRKTERDARSIRGIRPKSTFQIGGAGAVGTGSLRGMPFLAMLRDAGFCVWPFDPPRFPAVVEIYPRLLTGAVNKGSSEARQAYLERRYPTLGGEMRHDAIRSEDAFDAAISALAMDRARNSLSALPLVADAQLRLEGEIWVPPDIGCSVDDGEMEAERAIARPDDEIDCLEWRVLIGTMLPPPVTEHGEFDLVGGDPGEVVAEIRPERIRILQHAVRWKGQIPESDNKEIASFDPRRAGPRDVARAVLRARARRLATFQWCALCQEVKPPEWMHSDDSCQSCAERRLGVVY